MKNKAVFAVLICFLMIFTILPEAAFAGEAPELSVGGWFDFPAHATTYLMPVPEATDLYTVSSYDDWTVKFVPTTDPDAPTVITGGTMTLRGANILGENSEGSAVGIHANFDLEIILEGENFVTGGNCTGNNGGCYGINVEGNLTFSGTGSLEVKSGSFVGGASESDRACYGLLAKNIVVEGGQIVASAGEGAVTVGVGIYCEALKVKSGSISGIGGENPEQSYGIIAIEVAVPGGSVLAEAGEATVESFGLLSDSITLYGGNLASKTNAVSAGSKGAQKKLESDELPPAILSSGFDYFWRSSETGSWTKENYAPQFSDTYLEIVKKPKNAVYLGNGNANYLLDVDGPYYKNDGTVGSTEPADGYNAYYDAFSKKLYLNNIQLNDAIWSGIETDDEITIVLSGENKITTSNDPGIIAIYREAGGADFEGQEHPKNITIEGLGSLEIIARGDYAISGAKVTIKSGKISASGEDFPYSGIKGNKIVFEGGEITLLGASAIEGSPSFAGLYAEASNRKVEVGETAETADVWDGTTDLNLYKYIKTTKAYSFISGAEQTLSKGSAASFTVNGNYENLREVKVDETKVDEKWYTTEEGSTIITLKTDFLSTLNEGEHTITAVYPDGEAETKFTISAENLPKPYIPTVSSPVHQIAAAAPEGEENPNTGARMPLAALSAIVLLSAAAFAAKKK